MTLPDALWAGATTVAEAWGISTSLYISYCIIVRLMADMNFDDRWLHNLTSLLKHKYPKARRDTKRDTSPQSARDFTDLL